MLSDIFLLFPKIDEKWTLAAERSDEAGILLAECLLNSNAGHRPVSKFSPAVDRLRSFLLAEGRFPDIYRSHWLFIRSEDHSVLLERARSKPSNVGTATSEQGDEWDRRRLTSNGGPTEFYQHAVRKSASRIESRTSEHRRRCNTYGHAGLSEQNNLDFVPRGRGRATRELLFSK